MHLKYVSHLPFMSIEGNRYIYFATLGIAGQYNFCCKFLLDIMGINNGLNFCNELHVLAHQKRHALLGDIAMGLI